MTKKNKASLSENESLLQGIIDALKGNIAILDRSGNIIKTNQGWNDFVAKALSDGQNYQVGSNYIEACSQSSAQPAGTQIAQAIKNIIDGKENNFELEYVYQATKQWFSICITRFGSAANLRIIVNHENITGQKLIESALLESEQSYRILAKTASDVIIKIDSDNRILFINKSGEKVFGYQPSEMVGQSLTMIIPEHLPEPDKNDLIGFLQNRENKTAWESQEVSALDKAGRIFPLEISFGEFVQQNKHFLIIVARDVSERKQIEKSTARLAAIVESSDDAIISKDLEGNITSWNKGAEIIFGYTSEEIIGKSILTLIPAHLHSEELLILQRIRQGEQIKHFETLRRRKDGALINTSITSSPIQDESGKIIGASKIARDITERRQTEETLRENQMMLALAMQSSRMGAWEQDIATDIVLWSEELEEIFGLEKGAFPQTKTAFYELIHEDDRQRIFAEVDKAIREHRDYTIEFRFYHAGGSIRWMEGRGQAVYSDKGEPVRLYGIGVDITDRKEFDIALQRSESNLRDFLENASVGIHWVDADGIIIWANRAELEMLGYTAQEYVGHHISEFHANSNVINDILETLSHGETLQNFEASLRHKNGSVRYGLINSNVLWENDKFIHTRCFTRDITERKLAEQALIEGVRQKEALYQLANKLHGTKSFDDIYQATLKAIVKALQCARASILLYDDSGVMKFVAWQGLSDNYRKNAEGHSPWKPDEKNPIPISINDIDAAEIDDSLKAVIKKEGIRALAFIPLVSKGKLIGKFMAYFNEPHVFSENELELGLTIARQIATAMERRRAEDLLSKSAHQLALITDTIPVFIAQCDTEKRYKFVNKAYAERFGLKPEDLVGKFISDVTGEEAYQAILPYIETALSGQSIDYEIEVPYEGIGKHFMHCAYVPEFDESGQVTGWVATVTDISQRRKTEDALRESEKRFRTAVESAPNAMLMVDMSGKIALVNAQTEQLFGYTREELLGLPVEMLVPEKFNDFHAGHRSNFMTDPETRAMGAGRDLYCLRKDGKEIPVEIGLNPLTMAEGEFVLISVIDISERKQAHEALIKAERKAAEEYQILLQRIVPLGQTLGTARDLISIYRAVFEFVRTSMSCSAFFVSFYDAANKQRRAAFAWGEGAEVDISDLPPITLREDGGPNSQAVFQKKTVIFDNYWNFMKDHTHVVLQENGINPQSSLVVPMLLKNEVVGTLEVQAHENEAFSHEQAIALEMVANLAAVAIENVRLLEVEANARQIAEEANRAKDEFLSVLSHELRTPLNAIFGWTKMLKSWALDEALKNQAIETIERNARLQNNLIEDLLDVSRIISGKMRLNNEKIDFVSIVQDCVETAQPSALEKGIALEFYTQTAKQEIVGDPTRLQQVVNNLLNNAIKFTPNGGKISVTLTRKNGKIRLQISDTGIGISKDFLPLIFDRFKQADSTTKRAHSGLGLGMTIVRYITELHGGQIEVSSEGQNLGSTFVVKLPFVKAQNKSEGSANGNNLPVDSKIRGAKILLVDDDFDGLRPLQILLEKQQANVSCASSAREALKKLAAEDRFDLLISDIGMPEMDGYDLIVEARKITGEKNYSLPAIALTAYASSQDRERALSHGYQIHLSKPVDFEQFLLSVGSLLHNSKNT